MPLPRTTSALRPARVASAALSLALVATGCSSWQPASRSVLEYDGRVRDIRVTSEGGDAFTLRNAVIEGDHARSVTSPAEVRLARGERLEVRRPDGTRTAVAVLAVGGGAVALGVLTAVLVNSVSIHAPSGSGGTPGWLHDCCGGL